MTVKADDIWEMWVLWHWRSGIASNAYNRKGDLRLWAIENVFGSYEKYRKDCGKGKAYRIVKVDVRRAFP